MNKEQMDIIKKYFKGKEFSHIEIFQDEDVAVLFKNTFMRIHFTDRTFFTLESWGKLNLSEIDTSSIFDIEVTIKFTFKNFVDAHFWDEYGRKDYSSVEEYAQKVFGDEGIGFLERTYSDWELISIEGIK